MTLFQVLPDDMIVLAEPDPEDMVRAVRQAIDILPGIDPQIMHRRVSFNSMHLADLTAPAFFSRKLTCKFSWAYSNLMCIVDEKTLQLG